MEDLAKLDECRDPACPVQWPTCPSPVRLSNWLEFLRCHPDQTFASYIHSGLLSGFRIGYNRQAPHLKSASKNHPSAPANAMVVRNHIEAELQAGRLVGPLNKTLAPLLHTSPIGLVPKAHQPGKWRLIVDLSFPPGHSVNEGISPELASMTYAKVDEAVEIIRQLGVGTQLAKLDLQNAYRIVPIHPEDQHLLAIEWEGATYVDWALPFGLRSAPKIFSAVADMVAWVLHCAGIQHQLHYIDDFLFLGAPDTGEGARALSIALEVFQLLGIPVAVHKTEGPATLITFLGILIDTKAFELRLPRDKLCRLRELLRLWGTKKVCTRKELESLLGHLSHAATVVRPGRTFLRQLFSLMKAARAPHHYVRLNAGARADLTWWYHFLQAWNGSSFFPLPAPSAHIYSDASGSFGCGAFLAGVGWFQAQWPTEWEGIEISAKELVPVVMAAAIWGKQWSGSHVCFHCDNMAVVAILGSRTAKTSLLTHLLRCLSFFSAIYSFHFSALHIPGVLNVAADALSRNRMTLFCSLVPQTQQFLIPPALSALLLSTMPDWGSPSWTQLFTRCLAEVSPHPQ